MTRGAQVTRWAIQDAVMAVQGVHRAEGRKALALTDWTARATAGAAERCDSDEERTAYVETYEIAAGAAVAGVATLN